jgi:hypothetical protein
MATERRQSKVMAQSQWGSAPAHPDMLATASAMRETWRAEQEAAATDAVDDWRHRRSLRDLALEIVHRGDPVVAILEHVRFFGDIEAVGSDLLAIRSVLGRVDIHLHDSVPLLLQVGERIREGGARESLDEGDFRSSLIARERFGEVTLGCTFSPEPFDGTLVVGCDHLCLVGRGGGETYFPFGSVAYVMPRRD